MTTATKSPAKKAGAAKKAPAKRVAKPKPEPKYCTCFSVEKNGVFHSCGRTTTSRFAPGHDAKLKGALIKAAIAGEQFVTNEGKHDPRKMAADLGWTAHIDKALARHEADVKRRAARAEQANLRKAERDADREAKAAAKAAKAAAKPAKPAKGETVKRAGFHPTRVRIGRRVYDATISAETTNEVTVTYKDGKGNSRTETVKRSALVD